MKVTSEREKLELAISKPLDLSSHCGARRGVDAKQRAVERASLRWLV